MDFGVYNESFCMPPARPVEIRQAILSPWFNMPTGSYFFDDGKSRKFWSYTLEGKKLSTRHGRTGTKGSETTKTFPSASAAEAATVKLVNQKLAKGYGQIDPSKLQFIREKGKRSATKAQVARLERRLGARLPDDYKNFLLTQNGGHSEQHFIRIPGDPRDTNVSVGKIYGLCDEPKPFSLLYAVDKIQPRLPKGQLPVSGYLNFFSLSLERNAGCVYFWDEDAADGDEFTEDGKVVFNAAHGILVAGSFSEFLTRIALCKYPEETTQPATTSARDDRQKLPVSKLSSLRPGNHAMAISKRRQQEIIDLATPGVPPGTPEELWNDDAALDPLIRAADRKRKAWLQSATDPRELHLFAANWHWDGGGGSPLLPLVENPCCDAGTMLMLFWLGGGEDMYFQYDAINDIDWEFDREVHRLLRRIEKKLVGKDYATAKIYFDPSSFISMRDRRDEFARQIPEIMYQPIGRKPRG